MYASKQKKLKTFIFHKTFRAYEFKKKDGKIARVETKTPSVADLHPIFKKLGMTSSLARFENKVSKTFGQFGLVFDFNLFGGRKSQFDFFANKKTFVLIEKTTDFAEIIFQIIIRCETSDERDKILKGLRASKKFPGLNDGTFFEFTIQEKLDEILREDSPNGKKLKNPGNGILFKLLLDSKKRNIINNLVKRIGESPDFATRSFLINKFPQEEYGVIEGILDDKKLFQKIYRIGCAKCMWLARDMTFTKTKDVQGIIERGTFRCMKKGCDSTSPSQYEFPVATKELTTCLGGSWLEKYVDDILKKTVRNTWPCKMLGNDEIDNVFTHAEKVFFVECKDTSFGVSDLYSALMKSKGVEADEILVITTQPIHANVASKIKQLNDAGEYSIHVIEKNEKAPVDNTETAINDFLGKKEREFFKKILSGKSRHNRIVSRHF